ncbi:DUF3592 domain-containing protein [Kribbella sp. NPDC051770]|uniref:DUF3592 domain-containing protein n=1 Tax=Kribbella sp. NPDC051770 TaxID=3155413 RepID=UPI003421F879
MRRPKAPVRFAGCLLGALVLLGIGANAAVELARLDGRGVRVTATVVQEPPPGRGQRSFEARYATADGQEITTAIGRYDTAPKTGDQVEIVYDPGEPTVAKAVDAWETPWVPAIAYVAGAVLLTWIGLRRQRAIR